jgi:hypothetical protein
VNDPRIEKAVGFLRTYVRGERTDDQVFREVRNDPDLAPFASRLLRCSSAAQELLEAFDRSPFDLDLEVEGGLVPTRDGLRLWLDRVRTADQPPGALCDWATDALAWRDPTVPIDPVLEEVLSELVGSDDDVLWWTGDEERFSLVAWHLEHTDAGLADRVSLGLALARARDAVHRALLSLADGERDVDEVRGDLRVALDGHHDAHPTLVDDLIEVVAALPEPGSRARRIEALLGCVARTADPIGCADRSAAAPAG